jgi:hypothetical protein
MKDNEQADLERLRAWRRADTSRVLVSTHEGAVRLVQFKDGSRLDAEYPTAVEAVQALEAGTVHWVERYAIKSAWVGSAMRGPGWWNDPKPPAPCKVASRQRHRSDPRLVAERVAKRRAERRRAARTAAAAAR